MKHDQVKVVAMILMVVDHFGVYFYNILPYSVYHIIRMIGRTVAPLFLMLIIQSARFTNNRKKLIVRLYIANLVTVLFIETLNLMEPFFWSNMASENTFATWFFVVAIIDYIETSTMKNGQKAIIALVLILMIQIYGAIIDLAVKLVEVSWRSSLRYILNAIAPNPFTVEYSIGFIIIGVICYFARSKRTFAIIIAGLSCFLYVYNPSGNVWPFNDLFAPDQYWMILSLPFVLGLSDKKEKKEKQMLGNLDYFFYPAHMCLFNVLSTLFS